MIFKKIYTFLNNRLNGNCFSKSFLALIFITIFCFFFFASESKAIVTPPSAASVAKSKADKDLAKASVAAGNLVNAVPSISFISSTQNSPSGANINEFNILYQKNGLNPVKIYTSYLPPKNTYNNNVTDEHTLEYCGVLGGEGFDMIGNSCMIKIPFDCSSTPPVGVTASSGVNCLNYSAIFPGSSSESKKLNPNECEKTGGTEFTNCIASQKPYCHTINDPIIAINCKLAPCNVVPNQKYRRPGVNCLADCNDTSVNSISKPKFFIEGFNCLSSCNTKAAPKIIGENCVLEFNEYVMPLCNQQSAGTKNFNKVITPSGERETCLDVINLPLCSASSPASDELTKCVKECSPSLNKHNINCINFLSAKNADYNGYVDKSCHHYTSLESLVANSSCKKLDCHKLSDKELSRTLNVFDSTIDGFSTKKYCNPVKYTNFTVNQFKAINDVSNAYLRDYKLDNKPCYSDGDTEEIETVLSSDFFNKNPGSSKINYLKTQCTGLSVGGVNPLNCTSNRVDRTHADYDVNFLYDQNSFCTYGDTSQQILCTNYMRAPTVAPNDCNSPALTSCPAGSCPICQTGDTYCFKNGINCNSSLNQKYPICSALKNISQPVKPADDEYVSWFFRPTIESDAIRELTGAGGSKSYSLINMSGYPTNSIPGGTPDDNLYMSNQNLSDNGYIDTFWGAVSGSYILGTGTNMGLGSVGPENICGMNSDYRNIPTEDFAYFRGGVRTVYGLDDKLSHNVEICIRYKSSTNLLGTCGYRRCYTSCVGFLRGLSPTCSKVCGYDVCKTMSIEEDANGSQTDDCSSTSQNFSRNLFVNKNGRTTAMSCSSTYKTESDNTSANTRVRIYKPSGASNYICAVLDFRDITLDLNRNGQYFNGSEYFLVPDPDKKNSFKKLCVSGVYTKATDSCEGGVDTNNEWTKSSVWRTARIIKYIMQPSDINGNWDHANPNSGVNYLDQYGVGPANLMSSHIDNDSGATVNQTIGRVRYNVKRYFEKSDCIKHESKIGAPVFFSVANISNSRRLFLPPLIIEDVCEIASPASPSPPQSALDCVKAGTEGTDFFRPAIKILYGKKGATNSFLSVDPGSVIDTNYKLLKIDNPASDISVDYHIKALNIGIVTSAPIFKTVFIKKEQEGSQPKLCLYEKITLESGATPKQSLIKCVNRKKAQNAGIFSTVSDPLHTHLSFGAKFLKNNTALLSSSSDANLHSSIIDANLNMVTFSFETLTDLKNTSFLKKCKEITGNGFPICIEREECSILNNECVENEKALIIAKSSATPQYGIIAEKEVVSNYCKSELLTKCNVKKGYDITPANKTLNTSASDGEGFNAPATRNHYGWFNEFCITSGVDALDDKNQYVEELIPLNADGSNNEEIGKCKTMENPSDCSSCDNVICLKSSCCKIYNQASQSNPNVRMRKATPRELGLCYTITNYLKTCPAISYGKNDDITDPFFVGSSFLGSLVLNPQQSHIDRNTSRFIKNGTTYNSYNAEFDVAYGGISSVIGKCVGFYKNTVSQNNPTANCAIDGTWNGFSNSCTTYTCIAKKLALPTNGANFYGNYISSYDSSDLEKKSQAGSNEGYANWESLTKTGYLKQEVASSLCITGYAKKNATPVTSSINQVDTSSLSLATKLNTFKATRYSREINSLYKKISSFSGGINPTRLCNQLGIWESVNNSCERIKCPALNFEKPVDYDAHYMNDFDLAKSGDVLYCATPSGVGSPNKVKIDTGSFSASYVNAVADSTNIAGSGANNLSIKNSAGVAQTLASNRTYVLKKIPASGGSPAYWKILDNSNDEVLRALWIKSGGATFGEGYALRSVNFNYDVDSAKDPEDMHRITGTCSEEMGFNRIGAGLNPELLCDSNGNWTLLKNQCTSDCSAVNGGSSLSKGHGFANWIASKAKVGTSEIVTSAQCSTGYLPYPYPPQYDNEGVKGDFGVGALPASGPAFSTADVFDGIASTSDGANFVATPNAGVTLSPTIGNYYNFKISNLLNAGSQSSGSNVQTSFYLFNNSSLTLNAPTGSIWSKINFSSFGTPDYTNSNNLTETPTCHSEYSKFILGTKCIGKATCSISLSDFLGYDTLLSTPCKTPKYGNGTNGEQNISNTNFGSGGGGGGGNNPGSGGASTSSTLINGISGTSYYDKAFHLTPPTLTEGANKGLKVDLAAVNSGQFNGGKGFVQIEESTNNGSSYSITATFPPAGGGAGEYNHTINSGATNQDIYVKYIMIGGGGGGGGSGLTKGTNGANGTKMTEGVFVVKKGTALKIHVGGGGEAGKTRCRSAGGAFLDPRYINPAIEILEPEKETNFVVKALKGIGSLIVSEGWAQFVCNAPATITGIPSANLTSTVTVANFSTKKSFACAAPYNGVVKYLCGFSRVKFYNNSTNTNFTSTWIYHTISNTSYSNNGAIDDSYVDIPIQFNRFTKYNNAPNIRTKIYTSKSYRNGLEYMAVPSVPSGNYYFSDSYYEGQTSGVDTIKSRKFYLSGNINNRTFIQLSRCCTSDEVQITTSNDDTICIKNCEIPSGNGHNALTITGQANRNNLSEIRSGNITCNTGSGYTGASSLSYSCNDAGTPTYTGNCTCATGYYRSGSTPNTPCISNPCTTVNITGLTSKNLIFGTSAGSINCDEGYYGKVSYDACTTRGGSITPTGTCTSITACNIDAGNGHAAFNISEKTIRTSDAENLNGSRSSTVTCQNTDGYSGGSATFSCNDSGSLTTGNCTCATGYYRSGSTPNTPCISNPCTTVNITGLTSKNLIFGTSAGSINCDEGYYGKVSYDACTTRGGSITPTGTCTSITACNIDAGNGHAAFNISEKTIRTSDAQNLNGSRSSTVTCQNTGGYSGGSATFSCNDSGSLTTGNCTCATGYSRSGSAANTPCTADSCTTVDITGYASKRLAYGSSAASGVNCDAGYSGTVSYVACSTPGGSITPTGTCTLISACSIPLGNGHALLDISGTATRDASGNRTGNITCIAGSGYTGASSLSYSCNDAGTPTYTGNCTCATGYSRVNSSVANSPCERQCTISGVGYSADGPSASSFTGIGSGSFTCFTGFAGTINYTCTGPTSATLGSTGGVTNSCTKISCTANSGIAGIQSNTVIAYSINQQHIYCNDPLYNNFYTATFPACSSAGNLVPVVNANGSTTNNCQKITCAIPAEKNVTTASIDATAATSALATNVNLTCKAGYYKSSDTLSASCNTVNALRGLPPSQVSVPQTGSLNFTGTCEGITCTLAQSAVSSATDGSSYKYLAKNDLIYTGASPDKTFACNAGYVGNVTYNCNTATNGQPATYKSDNCKRIKCKINNSAISEPIHGNSYKYLAKIDLDYTGPGVFKTFPCNAGYVGNVSYKCDFTTDGEFATEITDNCVRIKCTIGDSVQSGVEHSESYKYLARRDLDYTGASPAKTFSCNEGYYGDVTYTCNYTTNGQPATGISDNCRRIKCDLPESAYSNLIPVSGQRTVDYSSSNMEFSCKTGYEQAGSYAPSYTCVGNAGKTNPATVAVSNACTRIQCNVDGTLYEFGETTIACSTDLGLYGNKTFTCNTNHSITYSQTCNKVLCKIPDSGSTLQNSAIDGRFVEFSGATLAPLDCKSGYYYTNCSGGQTVNCGRPQYTCLYDLSAGLVNNYGRLNLYGYRCERITCNLPTSGNFVLNSVLDNDPSDNNPSGVVNWTGSAFISTTCKEGFYMSDSTNPPKYSCDGTSQPGLITTNNSCSPVTCDIADRVGMFAKNNLEYGVNKTTSCNKPGYSGLVTYTCGGVVSSAGKGTLSGVSSTCKESSCDRAQNNAQTYDSSVGTSDQVGGAGGKILAASTFLKGGNGGSASNVSGVTSGSGGGGGSASMISINNRIVAIAGGGGGGAGGGITENTSSAFTKSNNYDLEQTLLSNVFGPYLVAEMQYSVINSSEANTAGVLYQRNSGSTFSLSAPAGMFINDIFLASSGNPTIDFSVSANLILKHGSCNNLQGLEEMNKCLGKESCSFTVDQSLSCAGITPNFGVVASYYFQEPTLSLKINPPSGAVLINSPAKNITQLDSLNRNFIAANNIRNDVVYTFSLLSNDNWAKFNYLSDEYYIPDNPSSSDIRVRFHRENTTYAPKLKVGNSSLEIKKDTGGSLTLGYIKTNIEYILRRKTIDSVEYWTIRPYISINAAPLPSEQREKPKRTCMTNLFSAGGGVNVIWSQPNSYCVSKCPGFADDNRIGVGATQHTLSNGVTAIAKWGEGNMGEFVIQRFTGATVANSSEDGGGLEFSKDSTSFDISVFRSDDATNKFILARYCNTDGTWSDPISLCEITNSDTNKTPPTVGATSYINSSTSTWGGYNNFMEANSAHTATSSCSDGYGPDFTGDTIKLGETSYYSTFKYKCVMPAGGKVDQAYFEKVPDSGRRDCIKFCKVGEYFKRGGEKPISISYSGKSEYKVKNGTAVELECESRYLPAKIGLTRPTDGRKPTVTCNTSSSSWDGVITNPCTLADRCTLANEGSVANNAWFPLSNFINETHRTNGMNHGLDLKVTYAPDATQEAKKYGKCGYCKKLSYVWFFVDIPDKYWYRRKYLKSYYCNDGAWVIEWENLDYNHNRACDGDEWDHHNEIGESWEWGGNEHPRDRHLGDCISNNTSKYSTNLPDQN